MSAAENPAATCRMSPCQRAGECQFMVCLETMKAYAETKEQPQ